MGFLKVRNKHTGHSVWHRLRLQSGVQGTCICMAQVKVARRSARYLRIAYS